MILLLGSHGYVGSRFAKKLDTLKLPFYIFHARYPICERSLHRTLVKNKITHVINCAGFVGVPNVDACEIDASKIACLQANALMPLQVAKLCSQYDIEMHHISSGCIYTDAACDRALEPTVEFTEDSTSNFDFDSNRGSWYSGTKALGETLLKQTTANIYRLRIPFDAVVNDRNYLHKLVKYNKLINATNSLSNLDEFVDAVIALMFSSYNSCNTFNLTQPGYITTSRVVEMLAKKGIVKDKQWFKSIEEFNACVVAPRSNCVLDSSKAIACGAQLSHVDDILVKCIDEYAFNLKNNKV